MEFYAGWNCVGSLKTKYNYTKKYLKITGQLRIAMRHNFIRKHPRIFVQPTQLRVSMKISSIRLPGNRVKIFISWDSASLTESESVFEYQKISTGKKLAPRNSAYLYKMYYEELDM